MLLLGIHLLFSLKPTSLSSQDGAYASPVLGQPIKFQAIYYRLMPAYSLFMYKGHRSEPVGKHVGTEVGWCKRTVRN